MSNEQTAMEMYGEALDALHEATGKLATVRADLREALDALAEVEAGVMTSAKLSAISADATAHLRYSLEPARAILRKHGRAA